MPARILAEQGPFDRYLVGDAARALQVTEEGVRHLVRDEQLTCHRTPAGYRVFREDEVLRLAFTRTQRRLRGCRTLRPKKRNVPGEPRQLSFLGPLRVEKIRAAGLENPQVDHAGSLKETDVSDKRGYGNRR